MARVKGGVVLSGRLGDRVYRDLGGRGFVSAMPETVNPKTPKQVEARERLALAMRLWAELPPDAIDRWRLYGMREGRRGDLAFRGLGAKYLQVHGGRAVPTEPPTERFSGDGIVVRAEAAPIPPGGDPWEDGAVVFSASGPNSQGAVTELLLQRLPARHRKPSEKEYRTQTFVAFAGEAAKVKASPGAWACAVRFVRSATGQASGLVPIGIVEVG